jgi:hypothetical protein
MDSFEYVYNHMMGHSADHDGNYPNEFFKGSLCDTLSEEIFAARLRLSRALDKNDSGENADAMAIVKGYEQMLRILCQRAYEYGKAAGTEK